MKVSEYVSQVGDMYGLFHIHTNHTLYVTMKMHMCTCMFYFFYEANTSSPETPRSEPREAAALELGDGSPGFRRSSVSGKKCLEEFSARPLIPRAGRRWG